MGGIRRKKGPTSRRRAPFYHEREVWWCTLGVNVGSEENGSGEEYRRPALILKGLSVETCLIVPLTTSAKDHPLRVAMGLIGGKEARAILSQMRVIDTKRLVRKIEYLDVIKFRAHTKSRQRYALTAIRLFAPCGASPKALVYIV